MIVLLSLQEYENILSSNLSGGNKRKLSVGIALIGNPSIVLVICIIFFSYKFFMSFRDKKIKQYCLSKK